MGTYGMASAQLYWGRMAALLLRLLYYIAFTTALLGTLLALGTPLRAAPKHIKVAAVLEDLINEVAMSANATRKPWAVSSGPQPVAH